jgi:hypothetical protein
MSARFRDSARPLLPQTSHPAMSFDMTLAIDTLGWIAAAALLYAYGAVSFHRLAPGSRLYHGLNILGSILLIINTAYHRAWPSAFVNFIWVFIAIFALRKAARNVAAKAE